MNSEEEHACINALNASPYICNGMFEPKVAKHDKCPTHVTLCQEWDRAIDGLRLNLPTETSQRWMQTIWKMHTEEGRHYHTAVHLEEMFHYLRILKGMITGSAEAVTEFSIISFAIFFHDCVYDPKSSTNEEDSALAFESFAKDAGIPRAIEKRVSEFIIATKEHKVSVENNTLSLSLFLDLDMAVLGKNLPSYMQYAALIRQEYSFVDHDVYCTKRAEILEQFLQQERIFGTSAVHCAMEKRARSNINAEIDSLRKGVIPS